MDNINGYSCVYVTSTNYTVNFDDLGCLPDIDVWGIKWLTTATGSTSTYDCYMSNGMYTIMLYIHMYVCIIIVTPI